MNNPLPSSKELITELSNEVKEDLTEAISEVIRKHFTQRNIHTLPNTNGYGKVLNTVEATKLTDKVLSLMYGFEKNNT
jgi:thiazole synthase ThiGH ThiG subunit